MKYRISIDTKNDVFEIVNSEEEAIARLREIVETDNRFIFMGTTNWTHLTKNYTQSKQVKWVAVDTETKTAKQMTKSILWYNTEAKERIENARRKADEEFIAKWKDIQRMFGVVA